MNKQKRISLSAPQSRSSRMRNIPIKANFNFLGTTISSLVPPAPDRLNYTQDELTKYIKSNGQDYCNAIMGVSCGDGGLDGSEWKQYSPYRKWYEAGGRCPKWWEYLSPNCTTGCSNVFGCVKL